MYLFIFNEGLGHLLAVSALHWMAGLYYYVFIFNEGLGHI